LPFGTWPDALHWRNVIQNASPWHGSEDGHWSAEACISLPPDSRDLPGLRHARAWSIANLRGTVSLDLNEREAALGYARKAYGMGYPLPGLKRKIEAAGMHL